MIISFLWGAIWFRDKIKNIWLTVLGIILILAGLLVVAMCKQSEKKDPQKLDDKQPSSEEENKEQTNEEKKEKLPLLIENLPDAKIQGGINQDKNETQEIKKKIINTIIGLTFCCGAGLLCGSCMVPANYAKDAGIMYCVSFGIGAFIVAICK